MARIPGGAFRMGADDAYPEEGPAREIVVSDFWIDETPVTNAQFKAFVEATGYVTFAEIPPDPAAYPGLVAEYACAGSMVFSPPDRPVDLTQGATWWRYVIGADWRHPSGPRSCLDGLDDHPVVHVAFEDARAYALWAGKSLPREAEWEYAARGGLDGATYAWGEELEPGGRRMAKIWEGDFPWRNLAPPGLERTSPVRSYPPNDFGLYDMIGNVWEWTGDWFSVLAKPAKACCGPPRFITPTVQGSMDPGALIPIGRRVSKGGSHLCSPDYCRRYRPAARWPQPIDTTTTHQGFRCVVRC